MTETPNLGLSQWSLDDLIKMADFNSDNLKIDNFGRLNSGLGNEYMWAKYGTYQKDVAVPSDTTTNVTITNKDSSGNVVCYVDTEVVDGEIVLIGQRSIYSSQLAGYYLYISGVPYLLVSMQDVTASGEIYTAKTLSVGQETASGLVGYVNSPDSNAYPVDDGYTYAALGQLGAKVQVATGSYVGTGVAGPSNPNSLTFNFCPKLIMLFDELGGLYQFGMANTFAIGNAEGLTTEYVQGALFNAYYYSNSALYMYAKKSIDGKTVYWYHSSGGAGQQANASGAVYRYIVIG